MSASHFSGPVQVGSVQPGGATSNIGSAICAQSVVVQAATAANVDTFIDVPSGSQIVSINADSTVAWTATTASMTIGSAAGGTQYVTGFDVKTITRGPTAAYTAAQLAALANVGSNTRIHIRVASTGANATGTTRVTVLYVPGDGGV